MSPARWQQVEALYHQVLDAPAGDRAVLLDQASAELRREVESLLAHNGSVLDRPVWSGSDKTASATADAVTTGTRLGPYTIKEKIGAGGMGQVFRAVDTRLNRAVAIKISRAAFDARFEREAHAIAQLNHPHICQLYDVGPNYLVMELIEGETLASRLKKGALPMDQVFRYGAQIADALAAAHAKGIVHRDLKPGNIMTTRASVKVLDFGIARATGDETVTGSLVAVGTPAYMSPEQREGGKCDARSDIYALGLVLREMVSGTRTGDLPPVPPHFAHIVARCLESDPEDRWQAASDVRKELDWAGGIERKDTSTRDFPGSTAEGGAAKSKSKTRLRFGLVSGSAVMLALAAGWMAGEFSGSRAGHSQLHAALRRITWDEGLAESPALSNDGRLLAFASDRAGGKNLDIFVRHISGGEPIRLTSNSADDTDPSFSPDGGMIAFRSERQGGGVYVTPTFGGQERLVAPRGNNPRFSPDGKWIAYWIGEWANTAPSARVYIVPATGGAPKQLQPSFADARFPIWTPDGAHILFQGVDVWKSDTDPNPDWWVTPVREGRGDGASVRTGAWDSITRSGLPYIYPPGGWRSGNVVFSARDDTARFVLEIPVSTRTWRIQGPAERLTFGTGIEGDPYPAPAGAIAFTSSQYEINMWSRKLDDSGRAVEKEARKLTAGAAYHSSASMNADGTRLVFLLGRSPSRNVWIQDLSTGREGAVTVDATDKCSAAISADGARVAWSVCGPGREAVYQAAINPDLSIAISEKVCDDCGRVVDWSRAGDSILFADRSHPVQVGILNLSSGSRTMIASTGYNLNRARYSPDGKWIAIAAAQLRDDRAQIFAVPLKDGKPGPEAAWVPITNAEFWNDNPVWTERGDALLFYSRRDGFGCIWRQAVNISTKRPEGAPTEVIPFHGGRLSIEELTGLLPSLSLAHDQILFNALERTGSIWVLDEAQGTQPGH